MHSLGICSAHWFWEGEGVRPDIEVWDDPNALMNGRDPQIERVVREVLDMMDEYKIEMTPAPPYEDRTAEGFEEQMSNCLAEINCSH